MRLGGRPEDIVCHAVSTNTEVDRKLEEVVAGQEESRGQLEQTLQSNQGWRDF